MDNIDIKRFEKLSLSLKEEGKVDINMSNETDQLWSLFNSTDPTVDAKAAWQHISTKIKRDRTSNTFTPYLKWAATIVFVISSIVYLSIYDESKAIAITAFDDHQTITLPDQSTVILSKGSSIKYDHGFEQRSVKLQGSGYFNVKKSTLQNFTVSTNDLKVTVLGTAFEVMQLNNNYKVGVTHGNVQVAIEKESYALKAGQGISYSPELRQVKHFIQINSIGEFWQDNAFNFDNQSLQQVLNTLSYHFEKEFDLESKSIGKCKVTGRFTTESLMQILDQITEALNLNYSIEGQKIKISGKGC